MLACRFAEASTEYCASRVAGFCWFSLFVPLSVLVAAGCTPADQRSLSSSRNSETPPKMTQGPSAQTPSSLASSEQSAPPAGSGTADVQRSGAQPPPEPSDDGRSGQSETSPAAATGSFRPVVMASWSNIQKFVAEQEGKIVILDLWSTSCGPCMRELPHLVGLQKELKDAVVCVTVSLDYYGDPDAPPQSYREKVEQFLRRIGADCQNFLCTDPDQVVLSQLQMASIPIVLVYDAQGRLGKAFNNDRNEYGQEGFTYQQHVIPYVKLLLSSAADQEP